MSGYLLNYGRPAIRRLSDDPLRAKNDICIYILSINSLAAALPRHPLKRLLSVQYFYLFTFRRTMHVAHLPRSFSGQVKQLGCALHFIFLLHPRLVHT